MTRFELVHLYGIHVYFISDVEEIMCVTMML